MVEVLPNVLNGQVNFTGNGERPQSGGTSPRLGKIFAVAGAGVLGWVVRGDCLRQRTALHYLAFDLSASVEDYRCMSKMTPQQVAFQAQNSSLESDSKVYNWLKESSAREIESFIQALSVYQKHNWLPYANVALDIRVAEDSAETANKLIQNTEKLTIQTDKQIQNTQILSNQTAELIKESKTLTDYTRSLKLFTILLFIVAIIQVVLWCIDAYYKPNK